MDVPERDVKVAEVVRQSGVSRGTSDRIKYALMNDKAVLQQLLSPSRNRVGRRSVIRAEETELSEDRYRYAARRGFALQLDTVRKVVADIARDERDGFRTDSTLPSAAAVRTWRAQNMDIKFRKAENKAFAKLQAENFAHVNTFGSALKQVGTEHPEIFQSSDLVWNMDETAVSAEFGQPVKVFGAADTKHGGFKAAPASGSGKHITAVVAVSASGRKTPPFLSLLRKYFVRVEEASAQGGA